MNDPYDAGRFVSRPEHACRIGAFAALGNAGRTMDWVTTVGFLLLGRLVEQRA